jgi:hypothetical protein
VRCALCKKAGNVASLRKSRYSGFLCKDAGACLARRLSGWKTPSKRAQWKKRKAQ